MKKYILLWLSVVALSGFASAGGDCIEEEPIAMAAVEHRPFYMGAGVGQGVVNNDQSQEELTSTTLMLQAGYRYNQYVTLEGRYTFGLNMDYNSGLTRNNANAYDGDFSAWGIYVKPMYPMGNFSLYALLGYGGVGLDQRSLGDAYENSLQWGLGASYTFEESIVVFADYVKLYDDEGFDFRAVVDDVDADTWNIGVSYIF